MRTAPEFDRRVRKDLSAGRQSTNAGRRRGRDALDVGG